MTDAAYAANRIRLMSPVAFDQRYLTRIAWLSMLVAVAFGAYIYSMGASIPIVQSDSDVSQTELLALEWSTPAALSEQDWTIFRGPGSQPQVVEDELMRRFRLAGMFFEYTPKGSRKRLAILEDRDQDKQLIVREREQIDDIEIANILRDHIVLITPFGEEVRLMLSFTADEAFTAVGETSGTTDGATARNAFGGRSIGKNSWLLNRETMLEYYTRLYDEPERMVLLFDSLKPVYTADGWIEGYKLGIEGERDFFDAMGLKEGDIVRQVNNVKMSNRKRAEFFVTQFVENEATAFALDVERAGITEKLTYAVR